MSSPPWEIGLEVIVAPRTWPGINKPGGHGKIVQIRYSSLGVVDSLDVRYTLGKSVDTSLDTDLVQPHVELNRGRRSRRGRDFFATEYHAIEVSKPKLIHSIDEKENDDPGQVETKTRNEAPTEPSKDPKKKTNTSRPRDTATQELLKKKRYKSNTNSASAGGHIKKPATKQAASNPNKEDSDSDPDRDRVPEFVVTNPSSTLTALSPLAFGKVGTAETPSHIQSTSKEEQEPFTATTQAGNNFGRKTLKNVFEDQMQEAACYIDSLVGGANAKKAPPASEEVKPSAPPLNEERCQEFTRIFSTAMRQNECLAKDELIEIVNQMTRSTGCTPFKTEETDQFVARLVAEDKIMLSDGYFYAI